LLKFTVVQTVHVSHTMPALNAMTGWTDIRTKKLAPRMECLANVNTQIEDFMKHLYVIGVVSFQGLEGALRPMLPACTATLLMYAHFGPTHLLVHKMVWAVEKAKIHGNTTATPADTLVKWGAQIQTDFIHHNPDCPDCNVADLHLACHGSVSLSALILANTLRDFGYTSCKADPDIWTKPKTKPNGDKYWEYVLVYVDDILCISHEPKKFMEMLQAKYILKKGSVGEPTACLGAEVCKHYIESLEDPTKVRWALSLDKYVDRAVNEVERQLSEAGRKLKTKVKTPLSLGYQPELDKMPELDARRANYCQGLIGILHWMCELGRVDILVDVSKLSRYLAAPREGHLEQVFHIFAYLKHHPKSRMVFDDHEMVHDMTKFVQCDWSEFYPVAAEAEPLNAPELHGKSVTMMCYVDADHAGCHETRCLQSGVLIYANKAPILWYLKRQNTVETSTF
jgi:hypothetical protein